MTDIEGLTETINIAIICSEFVTRYSFRKTVSILHILYERILTNSTPLTSAQIYNLLEVGKEYNSTMPLSTKVISELKHQLETLASEGDIEGRAYLKLINIPQIGKIAV